MVKKLKDGEASSKHPLKKAKNFFWKTLAVIFGFLFVASIAVCVLFATGMIVVVEDEESGTVGLRFESPLVAENNTTTTKDDTTNNTNNNTDPVEVFNGDDVGWAPSVQKECEEGNSTCEKNLANLPSIASFDLDLGSLNYNAGLDHPNETLTISDIRFTSNGRYAVAKFVSNRTQGSTVQMNDLYYYRSTYNSKGWVELKGLGNNQKLDCTLLNDTQRLIIEDTFPEQGCNKNDNY